MSTVYLHDIPLDLALKRFDRALKLSNKAGLLGSELIALDETAVGRVLSEAAWAKISSPHYHAAGMDGFAVWAADTAGSSPADPVTLPCGKGSAPLRAKYCDTGDPLPEWADAVIPIENIEPVGAGGEVDPDSRNPWAVRIRAAAPPWQYVRPMGEDLIASQLVLASGHVLRPVDLGALAAGGFDAIRVAIKPRVAIIPTGSELKPPGTTVSAGDIIEFNSIVLAGQINQWGGAATRYPIIPDLLEDIKNAILQAAGEHDLILINAGSSAGSEDYSAAAIAQCGEVLVHGVAVRPGHPVILGMIYRTTGVGEADRAVPIIGVPGYPVSAALTGEIFVEPLLARWLGRMPAEPQVVAGFLTRKITSPGGDDDYVRLVLGKVREKLLAAPLPRGSGVITSLVRADGIVIIPRGTQGLQAGAEVKVRLYRTPAELEHTILAIGSHDMTLDLLSQHLASHNRRLASSNAGSLGGLVALRRGEAHLAGSHLLDPASGEYNIAYIREYLPEVHVKVLNLVMREQGLMIRKGNPKNIQGLGDFIRDDVRIVNRQRGAGTRVLLDYHLENMGFNTAAIHGYSTEEYTHLAVAAAIASGRADCGLGIAAAAQALDLDFIPLFEEPYELVIPNDSYESQLIAPLLDLLDDRDFSSQVAGLPGYNIEKMGQIVAEL